MSSAIVVDEAEIIADTDVPVREFSHDDDVHSLVIEEFQQDLWAKRKKRICPDDFFQVLVHKALCEPLLKDEKEFKNSESSFDNLIETGVNPSNEILQNIQEGFRDLILFSNFNKALLEKAIQLAESETNLDTQLKNLDFDENENLEHRITHYYVQGLGFGYLDNQFHRSNFLKKLQNKYIIKEDEERSSNSFLRFCIRTLERIKLKTKLKLVSASTHTLILHSIVKLRSEWKFTCNLISPHREIEKLEFEYYQKNLIWFSAESELEIEIDWMHYLQEDLWLRLPESSRNFRRYEKNSYVMTTTQNLPASGLIGTLNYRWLYRDLYYPPEAQQIEEAFDLLWDKHQFFQNLPSQLMNHIGSFCTALIVSRYKSNFIKVQQEYNSQMEIDAGICEG
jgi:hypothetical protein